MPMQFPAAAATTNTVTLDAVIAHLAARDVVEGLVQMGTTGTAALTRTSDYDLLLILALPAAPVRMVTTRIDGHFTEVYCTTVRTLARIAADPANWPDASAEGAIVRWLQTGRIVHDRAGRLARARAAVVTLPPASPTERDVRAAWATIGYNLAVIERYMASDDPIAQEAVDWRLLYSLSELATHYFTVRRLPWRGEKAALRSLAREDPDFLDRFRHCLAETDRRRKVEHFAELARRVLAPVGGPWRTGMVVAAPGPGFGALAGSEPVGTAEAALAFWQNLIGPMSEE